jgi:hypothetical protein
LHHPNNPPTIGLLACWLVLFLGAALAAGCGSAAKPAAAETLTSGALTSSGTSPVYFQVPSTSGAAEFLSGQRYPVVAVSVSGQLASLSYSVDGGAAQALSTTGTITFPLDLSSTEGTVVVTMHGVDPDGLVTDLRFTVHDGTRPLLAYFPDPSVGDRYVYRVSALDSSSATGVGTLTVDVTAVSDAVVTVRISASATGTTTTTRTAQYPRRQGLNLAFLTEGSGLCLGTPIALDLESQLGHSISFATDASSCSASASYGRFAGTVTLSRAPSGIVPAGTFSDVIQGTFAFTIGTPVNGQSVTATLRAVGAIGVGMVYTLFSVSDGSVLELSLSGARLGTRTIGTLAKTRVVPDFRLSSHGATN